MSFDDDDDGSGDGTSWFSGNPSAPAFMSVSSRAGGSGDGRVSSFLDKTSSKSDFGSSAGEAVVSFSSFPDKANSEDVFGSSSGGVIVPSVGISSTQSEEISSAPDKTMSSISAGIPTSVFGSGLSILGSGWSLTESNLKGSAVTSPEYSSVSSFRRRRKREHNPSVSSSDYEEQGQSVSSVDNDQSSDVKDSIKGRLSSFLSSDAQGSGSGRKTLYSSDVEGKESWEQSFSSDDQDSGSGKKSFYSSDAEGKESSWKRSVSSDDQDSGSGRKSFYSGGADGKESSWERSVFSSYEYDKGPVGLPSCAKGATAMCRGQCVVSLYMFLINLFCIGEIGK